MKINFRLFGLFVLLLSVVGSFQSETANAFDRHWGGGHWTHDRHAGRLGWWWVAGPAWYFYPHPYAISQPQTVIIQQAPPQQPQVIMESMPPQMQPVQPQVIATQPTPVLYYCKSTETYYPDTMTCPGGWSTMVAGAPPVTK